MVWIYRVLAFTLSSSTSVAAMVTESLGSSHKLVDWRWEAGTTDRRETLAWRQFVSAGHMTRWHTCGTVNSAIPDGRQKYRSKVIALEIKGSNNMDSCEHNDWIEWIMNITKGSYQQGNLVKSRLFQHIEAEAKWPSFGRRCFQMHFIEWKYIDFDEDFIDVCSQWSN